MILTERGYKFAMLFLKQMKNVQLFTRQCGMYTPVCEVNSSTLCPKLDFYHHFKHHFDLSQMCLTALTGNLLSYP